MLALSPKPIDALRIVGGNLSPLGVDVRLSTQSKSFKDQSSSGLGLDLKRNLWNNHKTAKEQQGT